MKHKAFKQSIPYILAFLGAGIYISLIFNQNVWLDEAFTASLIRTDLKGVLERSMNDTLPPLYNILLKLVTDLFGYTIPVMKLVSVTPMILTMFLGAHIIRKRFGVLTSSLFITALFCMPNLLFYGVEIRMYSLGFFFATASGIYAYEVICDSSKKNWIFFTLFSVLAGYSHHFAFVTVGFVYLFLLLYYFFFERVHIRRWFFCLLATGLLYFPCLITTLKQLKSVSGYFSMPEVTLSVFIKYMRYPYTVGFTPLSVCLVILMLALLVRFLLNKNRTRTDYFALLCFLTYYGVLIFGTLISKIMTANIFVDRYLFFAISFIWLFFAVECSTLKKELLYAVFAFVIMCGIAGYIQEYRIEYAKGIEEFLPVLKSQVKDGDILYTIEDNEELAFCLPFYAPELTNYEVLDEAVAALKEDSTLYCTVLSGASEDIRQIDPHAFTIELLGEYHFDRYSFQLYKLIKKS